MIKLLHVDDDRISFEITRIGIRRFTRDIEVTWMRSAQEALVHLEDNVYDCILSDYQMPEMDGLEFLEIVRAKYQHLPFIILSGQSEEQKAVRVLKTGCSDYFTKEINIAHFQRLAHSIIKHVQAEEYHAMGELNSRKVSKYSALVNTIMDSGDSGYCVTDLQGKIETRNLTFSKTLSVKPDELIQSLEDIFNFMKKSSDHSVDFSIFLQKIRAENQPVGPHEIILKNGRVIEWSSSPMVSRMELQGHLLSFKDITEKFTLQKEVKSLINFMDHSNNHVIRVGPHHLIERANRCASTLLTKWNTSVGSHLPLKLQKVVSKCLASGKPLEMLESFGKSTLLLQLTPFPETGHVTIYGMDLNRDSNLEEKIKELHKLWKKTQQALSMAEKTARKA